jgi:hypothetical protein
MPQPWRQTVDVSLGLVDDLELQIARVTVELGSRGGRRSASQVRAIC